MSAELEVSVARMEVQVERLETDVKEVKGDVKAIRATIDAASGGWRMLVVVGTISAAIGAFFSKIIAMFPFGK